MDDLCAFEKTVVRSLFPVRMPTSPTSWLHQRYFPMAGERRQEATTELMLFGAHEVRASKIETIA